MKRTVIILAAVATMLFGACKSNKPITQEQMGNKEIELPCSGYDRDSDLNVGNLHTSIQASAFTQMSGSLCEGRNTFDGIWNLYAERVHSNTFAYVTKDFTVYQMNLDEFKCFVYEFCGLEKESEKNGGAMKIRCRKETKKMLNWLATHVAA